MWLPQNRSGSQILPCITGMASPHHHACSLPVWTSIHNRCWTAVRIWSGRPLEVSGRPRGASPGCASRQERTVGINRYAFSAAGRPRSLAGDSAPRYPVGFAGWKRGWIITGPRSGLGWSRRAIRIRRGSQHPVMGSPNGGPPDVLTGSLEKIAASPEFSLCSIRSAELYPAIGPKIRWSKAMTTGLPVPGSKGTLVMSSLSKNRLRCRGFAHRLTRQLTFRMASTGSSRAWTAGLPVGRVRLGVDQETHYICPRRVA